MTHAPCLRYWYLALQLSSPQAIEALIPRKETDEPLPTPTELTERIFQELDVNSDDRLSKEEFVRGIMQHPQLLTMIQAKRTF